MLLKCTADGRRIKVNATTSPSNVTTGGRASGMKMTMSTTPTMTARVHRKVMRAPHKRVHPGKLAHYGGKMTLLGGKPHLVSKFSSSKLAHYARLYSGKPHASRGKMLQQISRVPDPYENSNDNGIGPETTRSRSAATAAAAAAGCSSDSTGASAAPSAGKPLGSFRPHGKLSASKLGGKMAASGKLASALARRRALVATPHAGPPTLSAHLPSASRDGTVQLQIVCQPETQHRARYQTEGSRGAVKDDSGNGFPVVKLVGYNKPAVLEVFIGTDTGRVAPHMFYQACRVSGKNSTPCRERKEDGTVLIEIDLDPAKSWQVTCDCVGILKERNVDVEHRFGEAGPGSAVDRVVAPGFGSRGKKKSTRCRMVFRTHIVNANGVTETLQVCSTQIVCTQPPGVAEISRKSLVACPARGGYELFLLGKNFLKDTRVVFAHSDRDGRALWQEHVAPDKDVLQQTHLVCCVPPYVRTDITETVAVQLYVVSGGKASESHPFYYTPIAMDTGPQYTTVHPNHGGACSNVEEARPVMLWGGGGSMMPPPALPPRRPSLILPDPHSPLGLKSELDETSQHSLVDHSESSNMSFVNENSCEAHSTHQDSLAMDQTSNSSDVLLRSRLAGLATPSQLLIPDEMKVMDLRLKSESLGLGSVDFGHSNFAANIKLSPPSNDEEQRSSPLASFTRQLQAIHTQVQTDKMVESVTAALFQENQGPIYSDPPILIEDNFNDSMKGLSSDLMIREAPMKTMNSEMLIDAPMPPAPHVDPTPDPIMLGFVPYSREDMCSQAVAAARSISEQTAQMEALVDDAMQTSGVLLPGDAAKLDALVNSTVSEHMCSERGPLTSSHAVRAGDVLSSGAGVGPHTAPLPSVASISPDGILSPQVSPNLLSPMRQPAAPSQDELMLMSEPLQMPSAVKTPPAAVKSMILNAAAEILTSDSAMNALVTSAINTANILQHTNDSANGAAMCSAATGMQCAQISPQPHSDMQHATCMTQTESSPEAAMSQAVSQAVTQAVSQAVSHAVSQAVSQEMVAPVQGLTDMSDSDLLSYINPSTFDQV